MIQFKAIGYAQGQHSLVQDATLSIPMGARVGLIGANGSGKSSLFQVIMGDIEPETGEMFRPKNIKISHIAQEVPSSTQSALDFVLDGHEAFRDIETRLTQAELESDYDAFASLYEQFEAIDGQRIPVEASKILRGLGFNDEQLSESVNSFSGGWRVRLQLARTLLCPSDLLLMDEPTNHLDLEAIFWLEKWCKKYEGTLILIAHDIAFLDNVVNHIVHIEHKTLNFYKGNYSFFVKDRAEKIALNEKMRAKQQKERAHLEKFINRFRAKATKAKQAQSRIKRLERMEDIAAIHATTPIHFNFEEVEAPTPLIRIQKGVVGYDGKAVLQNMSFYLGPGDRYALLGKNGEGKSTFVKLLAKQLKLMQGDHYTASKLIIGYFAQHQVEALSLDKTPFDIIHDKRDTWTEQQIRDFLGSFQFMKDKVFNQVSTLSGGERARLALALLVLDKPQVILLDEPTNHLDIEMREALALALQTFNGALVVVSHDRAFIEATCDDLVLIDSGCVQDFKGNVDDYAQLVKESDSPKKAPEKEKPKEDAYKQNKQLTNTIKSLEKDIEGIEKKLKAADALLADEGLYDDKKKLNDTLAKRDSLQKSLAEKEAAWEQAQASLENLRN